jgi:hypothetical protein
MRRYATLELNCRYGREKKLSREAAKGTIARGEQSEPLVKDGKGKSPGRGEGSDCNRSVSAAPSGLPNLLIPTRGSLCSPLAIYPSAAPRLDFEFILMTYATEPVCRPLVRALKGPAKFIRPLRVLYSYIKLTPMPQRGLCDAAALRLYLAIRENHASLAGTAAFP